MAKRTPHSAQRHHSSNFAWLCRPSRGRSGRRLVFSAERCCSVLKKKEERLAVERKNCLLVSAGFLPRTLSTHPSSIIICFSTTPSLFMISRDLDRRQIPEDASLINRLRYCADKELPAAKLNYFLPRPAASRHLSAQSPRRSFDRSLLELVAVLPATVCIRAANSLRIPAWRPPWLPFSLSSRLVHVNVSTGDRSSYT